MTAELQVKQSASMYLMALFLYSKSQLPYDPIDKRKHSEERAVFPKSGLITGV